MGVCSHGTYRGKYSSKRVGKKSKLHLHPFFFLTTGIKVLHREYIWISLKCCMRNTRNQNMKLTCPIFRPRTQATPAVLRQLLSAVIQWSQAQGNPGFSWRLWFKPRVARNSRQKGTCKGSERLSPLVPICWCHFLPYTLFPTKHTSYWPSVIPNTNWAHTRLRYIFSSFLQLVLAHLKDVKSYSFEETTKSAHRVN